LSFRSEDVRCTATTAPLLPGAPPPPRCSASYDAALIVEPAHHDEWLDGWSKTEDLRSCIQPLRLGRMVVDKP
jgi:hypothetical protein